MNMHVATPTERLLYAAHQERLRKFWPVREEAVATPAPEPTPLALPKVHDVWFRLAWEYLEPKSVVNDGDKITIGVIKSEVCTYFGLTPAELISHRRTANVVRPRHIAFYLSKKLTGFSLPVIGKHFGGKDHTTVLSGVRSVERKLQIDPELASDIAAIERRLA